MTPTDDIKKIITMIYLEGKIDARDNDSEVVHDRRRELGDSRKPWAGADGNAGNENTSRRVVG